MPERRHRRCLVKHVAKTIEEAEGDKDAQGQKCH